MSTGDTNLSGSIIADALKPGFATITATGLNNQIVTIPVTVTSATLAVTLSNLPNVVRMSIRPEDSQGAFIGYDTGIDKITTGSNIVTIYNIELLPNTSRIFITAFDSNGNNIARLTIQNVQIQKGQMNQLTGTISPTTT